MPATQYKTVAHYTMICDHEQCRRTVARFDGRPFVRTTTCRRHKPKTGFIMQRQADKS